MQFGNPGSEKIILNVDSLWSGGPFENSVSTHGSGENSEGLSSFARIASS